MAKSLNRVQLFGRVGRDAELSYVTSGKPKIRFTMATSWGYGDKEKTTWHFVIAWDKLAETLAPFIKKGIQLFVDGRLDIREYEKDGVKKIAVEVVAQDIILPDKRTNGDESSTSAKRERPAHADDSNVSSDDLEEVPF